ncbi:MAG: prepilin-type N-terminal cleavage/methylation domain-containing protein [Planctomycetes bacterium]|nr:prepilin-type N-terminal cleavage/methylation domain-containing protein [Planctomycetota bacterium]
MSRVSKSYRSRPSFTLVELLIVISIVSVLASAVLFALNGVMEDAKATRTEAQIAKLHEMVMARLEGYETRSLRYTLSTGLAVIPMRFDDTNGNGRWDPTPAETFYPTGGSYESGIARLRLDMLRDLMRMELPDRRSDIAKGPATLYPGYAAPLSSIKVPQPSLHRGYRQRAKALAGASWPTVWTTGHQGAECLYLIAASIRDGDATGIDSFRENEIGDVDADGMPEILDGWGNPIEFLRWAPGFFSEAQSQSDADPFDPFDTDTRSTYRLVPLIYSAGRDGLYDIFVGFKSGVTPAVESGDATDPPSDPYASWVDAATSIAHQLGDSIDAGEGGVLDGQLNDVDNITNHLLLDAN